MAGRHSVCAGSAWGRQRRVGAGRSASLERSSAERADCPAVLGLAAASPNSLRSLRSLRSNSGDEHEDERAARWPQALRSSAPQKARHDRPPHTFAAGLLVFGSSQPGVTLTNVSVGSGLELQHCDATPDRHPYGNVAIQDLTPAPSAHETHPLPRGSVVCRGEVGEEPAGRGTRVAAIGRSSRPANKVGAAPAEVRLSATARKLPVALACRTCDWPQRVACQGAEVDPGAGRRDWVMRKRLATKARSVRLALPAGFRPVTW